MTGWQGNEGGWNPQPDPHGQQYGADPYGGQQFGGQQYDPYGQQQYGSDPYAQQYGMPYQGFAPPPPEKKSKLPIVLSIVAIVAIVGAVVTIVLLNRGDDPSPSAGPAANSSSVKPPSSPSRPSTSRRPPSSTTKPPTKEGWTAIDGTGLAYQVPPGWKAGPADRKSGLEGVTFRGGAEAGAYDCEGSHYFRGFAATGDVQSKSGGTLDLNKTITDFANSFAGEYYPSPKIELGEPASKTVDGKTAAALTAKLTITPTKPACEATSGEVAIVGVRIEEGGKTVGVRMLVVVNDLAGGPADPPGLADPVAEEILDTVTVK